MSRRACSQRKYIHMEYLDAWIRNFLELTIRHGSTAAALSTLFGDTPSPRPIDTTLLTRRVEELEASARKLISAQMSAPPTLYTLYEDQLAETARQIEQVRADLLSAQPAAPSLADEQAAITELRLLPLDDFFTQSDAEINARLHRLFGRVRLVILDQKIVRYIDRPPHLRLVKP